MSNWYWVAFIVLGLGWAALHWVTRQPYSSGLQTIETGILAATCLLTGICLIVATANWWLKP
ncbi:MAG: hypothetical protein K9N49_03110 [Candidatus Marinimicrobia bacterium]|nr:hypothetical protein [Candidatus Neomarinimicrobiota bacterium]